MWRVRVVSDTAVTGAVRGGTSIIFVREVFTGFGRLGATAERVANEAVKEARNYLAAGVPVGPYLADQLLLPLGIAAWQTGRGGSFKTQPLTRHSQTHIELLRSFLEIPIDVEREGECCRVTVGK